MSYSLSATSHSICSPSLELATILHGSIPFLAVVCRTYAYVCAVNSCWNSRGVEGGELDGLSVSLMKPHLSLEKS